MRIAVQQSRVKEHRKVSVERYPAQPPHILLRALLESLPDHPAGREDPLGRQLGDDLGCGNGVEGAGLHGGEEALRVDRLPLVVQLVHETRAPAALA
eukprot:440152-Hanusia_phi.AAC.1